MPESIYDIYKFFEEEAIKIAGGGYKSDKIRNFIRNFGKENEMDMVVEFAVYNAFLKEHPEITMDKNYFHTVAKRAWECETDENSIVWINLTKQKPLKPRKNKV